MSSLIEPCDFDRISWEEKPQAERVASWMKTHHHDARILDVGCGPGLYVNEMRAVGLDAYGIDRDERLIEGPYLRQLNLVNPDRWPNDWVRRDLGFDVALSLEVGEHIPEDGADAYIRFIANTNPRVLYFSAARPGQGGEGHINLQPKAYWVEKMHRAGFWLDPDATDEWLGFMRSGPHLGWLTQNGICLKRA